MSPRHRYLHRAILVLALLGLAACGGTDDLDPARLSASELSLEAEDGSGASGLPACVETPFVISNPGFLPYQGQDCVVRFRASSGSPFEGGTSSTAEVIGHVTSTVESKTASTTGGGHVEGVSPLATICGELSIDLYVTVIFADGTTAESEEPVATLLAPPLESAAPDSFPALSAALEVVVTGDSFPEVVDDAVLVHWVAEHAIFEDHTSTTTTTSGRVVSETRVEAAVPAVAVSGFENVVALIDSVEFSDGTCTAPGAPPEGTALEVTFEAPRLVSVSPDTFTEIDPYPTDEPCSVAEVTEFEITGTGILREDGVEDVVVHWRALGPIFEGGTTRTTTTPGVITPARTIRGSRPEVVFCGAWEQQAVASIARIAFPDGSSTPPLDALTVRFDEPVICIDLPILAGLSEEYGYDDSIQIPRDRPAYTLLVSGYTRNERMNEIHWYLVAKYVAEQGGYVHVSWWNNLCKPYLEGPLHGGSTPDCADTEGVTWEPPEKDDIDGGMDPGDLMKDGFDAGFPHLGPEDLFDLFSGSIENSKAIPSEDYQFQADAMTYLAAIRAYNPDAVIVVAGHSMGGCAVARLGANSEADIDLLAPIDPVGNRSLPYRDLFVLSSDIVHDHYMYTRWRATHNDPPMGTTTYDEDEFDDLGRRVIKENVFILFHRWQKEFLFPFDFLRDPLLAREGEHPADVQKAITDEWNFYTALDLGSPATWRFGSPAYEHPGHEDVIPTLCSESIIPGFDCAPWRIWHSMTDGHGEIVGYRGANVLGNIPPSESFPLAVRLRNWPCGTDADAIAARRALFLRLSDPADAAFEDQHAPYAPEYCLVSPDMVELLDPENPDISEASKIVWPTLAPLPNGDGYTLSPPAEDE